MNFASVDNKLIREADDYIRSHRLLELFEVINIFKIKGSCNFNRLQTTREFRGFYN